MLEFKDVDYILSIARCQSISGAAEELYISQPALTKYLQSLEQRIGLVLFNRSKKKLIPTLAGERYVAYAAEMASIMGQLECEIAKLKSNKRDMLKVGFSCTGLREIIFDAISLLNQREPALQTDFRELTTPEIEKQLLDYKLDLGFITLPASRSEIETEVVLEENILLGIPMSHPLATLGTPVQDSKYPWINLRLFKEEPFVLRNTGTRFRSITDQIFKQNGFIPHVIMTTRNQFTCVEFAEKRQVPFFTPESFIKHIGNSQSIKFFVTGSPISTFPLGIAYRKGDPLSAPAHKLMRIIKELMKTK